MTGLIKFNLILCFSALTPYILSHYSNSPIYFIEILILYFLPLNHVFPAARLCCTVEEENAHEEALCAAAAAQAAYQFWLLEEAASPKSLTAGEVRAEFDKGSERALAYAKQCERAVSGLLRDEDFYFGVTEDTV